MIPNHNMIIAGRLCIFSTEMELLETSCKSELVSIKPPKISPKERKTILQPNEPKNFFPDLSWE